MLIDRLLINTANRFPNKIAFINCDSRVTYSELLDRSMHFAAALQEYGLRCGDRVIIALDNSVEYLIAYFGVQHAGGTVVAVSPDIKQRGLLKIAADCKPVGIIIKSESTQFLEVGREKYPFRFIIVHGDRKIKGPDNIPISSFDECCMYEGAVDSDRRTEKDIASIIYTSGTTGEPKGVMLSHKNLSANSHSIVNYLSLSEKDSVMVAIPFYYSYGNSLLLTHIMQGGALVVDNRFMYPNVVLESMVKENVTGFAGVPSTFAILLNRSNFKNTSLPSLRYITQAGGPMPHTMAFEILKTAPHAKFYIMYGQTEASARLSYLPPNDLHRRHGSVGKAIPGVTLQVINEKNEMVKPGETGEIVAAGDNIMAGYWEKPEETAKVLRGGRLYTGDMATVDEDGYIYILSRKSDMIKSGAHRIAPREIEDVILEHPSVFEVAVVGKKDPILGEAIYAYVVLKEVCACIENELMKLCHENLPAYKVPKNFIFIQSLPKTESGKIKKEELKKIYNPIEVSL
jgi:acyl-CoA synthetase (AMP-forming)/AMP-acid ligase II